ncbi:protein YIPF5/7 [Nematocida sp. AWRm80]|nr:protein YIPF5/7 [Nematocida sp. AWRm80]
MEGEEFDFKKAILGYTESDGPLLTELGINIPVIYCNMRNILSNVHISDDTIGPMLFLSLFTILLLIRGRVYISYIYFLSIINILFIYTILNTLINIDMYSTISIMGYSFLPTLIFSLINIIFPGKSIKMAFGVLFGLWSTFCAVKNARYKYNVQNKTLLITYPIFLVYLCFIIIAIV